MSDLNERETDRQCPGAATSAPTASVVRRDFLKTAGLAGIGLVSAAADTPAADHAQSGAGKIPLRPLGKATDVKVSALGLGGHHLGDVPTVEDAIELVHEAIDGGITFFDNCWEYHNGKSENWLGRAPGGKRDKVFLMTKVCTHGRERSPGDGDARAVAAAPADRSPGSLADPRRDLR